MKPKPFLLSILLLLLASPAYGQSFDRAVIKAARQARQAGEITQRQLLKLRIAMVMPRTRAHVKQMVTQELYFSGDIQSVAGIDWENLIPKIQALMEAILKFIEALEKIFNSDANGAGAIPPPVDPTDPLNASQQAARNFTAGMSKQLGDGFRHIVENFEPYDKTRVNAQINSLLSGFTMQPEVDFRAYANQALQGKTPDQIKVILADFATGFGCKQ